ncbi:hypothetical protein ACIHDR_35260 [Nocardia sp. NPDC052278]|uniref:hypothetical protein n=1 Tax=unclassified Nocardia TaxID=2637762 RepID=UPI0036A07E92
MTRTATGDPTVQRRMVGAPGERRELVEVSQQSRDLPVRDQPIAPTESGRLIELLGEKSEIWGFQLHSDGTRTRWFELFESDLPSDVARPRPDPIVNLTLPHRTKSRRAHERQHDSR